MPTVKPDAVCVYVPNAGVNAAANEDVDEVLALPSLYPERAVLIVATEDVFGDNPVIVAKPFPFVPLKATEPLLVAVPLHVYAVS
jgi:hypothetical protein